MGLIALGQNELPPVRGERSPAEDGLSRIQPAPSDSPILFVGRRYAPVYRMDHYEIGEGGRSDCLPRKALVYSCDVSFSVGAPLPGCAWLAVLRWHADENSCKYRNGEVCSILRCKWSFAGLRVGKAFFR